MRIERVYALPAGINDLVTESSLEGYRFLERLVSDFSTGANCFDNTGEALFAAFNGDRLIGVGGLNIDPFSCTSNVGRIRRLFVSKSARASGVGTALMVAIEHHAIENFAELQLYTDTSATFQFYARLGYEVVDTEKVSHRKQLTPQQNNSADA